MLFAAAICALGLAAVLIALYRDEPLPVTKPALPEWDLLPTPSEVARGEFGLAFPGYDPASVEIHFDLLRRAYDDLYAAATPEVLERAQRRAHLRAGQDFAEPEDRYDPGYGHEPEWEEPADDDDVRLEAVLASVDPPEPGGERT